MAWHCSGPTNAALIANMVAAGIIADDRVAAAMAQVDRAHYVRESGSAYEDSPQSIGHGATISAPHMHAYAAAALVPFLPPAARVLDVGAGSGYLAAVLHHLAPRGHVVAVEHVPALAAWAAGNLVRDGLGGALEAGRVRVVVGDGRRGFPEGGPYDAIHVGAAAPTLPPALVEQLASPGRMFIPIGTGEQHVYHVDKDAAGRVVQTRVMGVRYVPLTDLPE